MALDNSSDTNDTSTPTESSARDEAFADALSAFDDDGEAAAPSADADAPEAQPEASKEKDKEADKEADKAEPEKLSKGFQKLRRDRKTLTEQRESLARAKAEFQAQQHALVQQAREGEKARQQLEQVAGLLARAQDGDQEAIAELRLDIAKINEGYLRHATGDAKIDRMARTIEELTKRLEARDKDAEEQRTKAKEAAEHDRLYQQAVGLTLDTAKAKTRVLKSYKDDEIVSMAESLAQRYAAGNKPVPHPAQLVEEIERQLIDDLTHRRAVLDGTLAPAKGGSGPATITARDKGAKGNKAPPKAYSREAEAEALARVLRGEVVEDDD